MQGEAHTYTAISQRNASPNALESLSTLPACNAPTQYDAASCAASLSPQYVPSMATPCMATIPSMATTPFTATPFTATPFMTTLVMTTSSTATPSTANRDS
eukprot:CAMPEP_0181216832 /NCGR_PEP_ID=MMETSP1096-20121128/26810_1 /TAXON_ID=156174 ORGANISM="Chrysochromulina ericina, Strain CCMP281" /NCGR_SAMPLE_ID=MMETSP1096 /ASSEMBLY_ACC=CAM_ASM_000453 /LENGTH=100 /DNA_ID=CAMNT_0023308887 /DNA_START=260 /DNA_END=562 /DNA_ORIENTATION=+